MNFDAFSNPAIASALRLGNTVTVENIFLAETGTYNPLFSRNFEMNRNAAAVGKVVNDLSNRVLESGLTVTPDLMAGLSSSLVAPSADAGSMLSIPSGWDRPRFRMRMIVRVGLPSGMESRFEIQGYSEHKDIMQSGIPDSNMRFYINSITKIASQVGINGQSSLVSQGSAQILNGAISMTPTATGVFALRPRDVVGEIQTQYTQADAGVDYKDGRANLSGRSAGSTRTNAIPASYLSTTLEAWMTACQQNEIVNDRGVVSNSLTMLAENFYDENPFVSAIIGKQGVGNGGWFTFNTLSALDPSFTPAKALMENRLNIMMHGGMTAHDIVSIGSGSHWNGRDIEAIWAASLAQSIPAIMSKYYIGKFGFTATNQVFGGQIVITPTMMKSSNVNAMNQIVLTAMINEIQRTILKDLSMDNLITFNLTAAIDSYGDTRIDIAIDNRPVQTFFMPTFCDAIASPMLTHDRSNLEGVAHGIESIVRTVVGNTLGGGMAGGTADLPTMTVNMNSY